MDEDNSLLAPGLNAHRHPQQPLRPPGYLFKDVTRCSKDLKGSVLYEITDRDHFKETMAEMVLLCTEAMRRTSATRSASKPLSLEYIADRLDVDDPCFGYAVRSKEGMLQGFITVTTFTNWQKTFRWDSLHELSFYYDDSDSEEEEDCRHCPKQERRVDRDGRLARELQQTVRLGDPYHEGIVWPRIAEISLLGGLGCGKTLVKLVIEQLEFRKSTGDANYDYIALQATDNSIPFYESIGFARVGAVTVQESVDGTGESSTERSESRASISSTESSGSVAVVEIDASSPEKTTAIAMPPDIVSSPYTIYEVKRGGESVDAIGKKLGVDVWDIIFLNKQIYKEMTPKSRLRKATILHVPLSSQSSEDDIDVTPTRWFVAKENDTAKKIAKQYNLPCKKLVAANRNRLPALTSISRLKEGTRIKVSNLDKHDDVCDPYCHWSYPDDQNVDEGEPSYMMVYKLDRTKARGGPRDVLDSLAIPISDYEPPQLLLPRPEKRTVPDIKLPDSPIPPPEPMLAEDIFKQQQRDMLPKFREKTAENEKILDQKWDLLSVERKSRYNEVAIQTRKNYEKEYQEFESEYRKWQKIVGRCKSAKAAAEKEKSLFSTVVTLKEDAMVERNGYKYWFVLTYVPDLKWCHLAPMVQDGVFGPERKKSHGRPRWRLVDESAGHELDTSSVYCVPVKSKALRKTKDADKEEWDILDGEAKSSDVNEGGDESTSNFSRIIRKKPKRARPAIKPLNGKVPVIQPIKPAGVRQDSLEEVVPTPRRSTGDDTGTSPSNHDPSPVWTPSRGRRRRAVQSVSPRRSPKRNASNDLNPIRKARKVNSSGARRSVLQL